MLMPAKQRYACLALLHLLAIVFFAQRHSIDAQPLSGATPFVELHRCQVIERLRSIHEAGTRSEPRNRYLTIALKTAPDRFVQCIFHDDDTKFLCEAASGFYARRIGREPIHLSAQNLRDLAALGFSTDDSNGNFIQRLDNIGPADFPRVAQLLLSTLHDVYDARVESTIEYIAPLAQNVDPMRCRPAG